MIHTDEQNTQPQAAKSKMPVLLVGIVVLVLIGAVAFFAMQSSNQTQPTIDQTTDTTGDAMTNEPTSTIDVTQTTGSEVTGQVQEFTVEGSSFKFSMPEIRVKMGDTVKITFENTQGIHDFVLDEFNVRTQQLQTGQSETIEFIASQQGTFEYYCSVGNHRQMGMMGNLIVE